MQIDTFTLIAQIVNFLILVALLKRFLYGPIVRMMEERQARISARLDEARAKAEKADSAREAYEQKRRELDEQTRQIIDEAEEQAEERRAELLDRAREEADRASMRWRQAMERERSAFARELRRRAGLQVVGIARRALQEMADAELESRAVSLFAQQIRDLDDGTVVTLSERMGKSGSARLVSAFELNDDDRETLAKLIAERFGDGVALSFETSPDLICGLELRTDGRKVVWSMDSYLTTLEEEILRLMDETPVATESDAEEPAEAAADEPGGQQ
ncbi:MAG: F0F1 ATP synthase subunit B [Armatimonadetes bacterium]|nr:F0F1 ATP synthase subunit B [Armatimonadota bacterium]